VVDDVEISNSALWSWGHVPRSGGGMEIVRWSWFSRCSKLGEELA